ncbi:hypothetical protein [Calorimonas adulescens]|uniref:Uncharacterized protein n=1 Tax=Calorimonas adulescens TaxID=2606906 RepID=A0A5D8QEN6_9THEO|nr:hypothetical protein [Calorimonas adulescens]TZE81983.1 hypothetical protein FWJ32_07040 [Calorimonas adulescens]
MYVCGVVGTIVGGAGIGTGSDIGCDVDIGVVGTAVGAGLNCAIGVGSGSGVGMDSDTGLDSLIKAAARDWIAPANSGASILILISMVSSSPLDLL